MGDRGDRFAPQPPSRTLFVGNFPFEMGENEIRDILNRHGSVTAFKLVTDREQNRSKGYGFVEYSSIEDASRAIESLKDVRLGQRQIRTAFSQDMHQHRASRMGGGDHGRNSTPPQGQGQGYNQGGQGGGYNNHDRGYNNQDRGGYNHGDRGGYNRDHSQGYGNSQQNTPQPAQAAPAAPAAPVIPLTTPDVTSEVLSALNPTQLLDLIAHLKSMVASKPMEAAQILQVSEPITYAAVQAMLLMGLVDANVVQQALSGQVGTPTPASASHTPTPAPAPPQQPQLPPGMPTDPQQLAMIRQVMELTDAQLASLPHEQRGTLTALRDNYRRGIFT